MEFHKVRFRNVLSYGNTPTEIDLNTGKLTTLIGNNGDGKCCDKLTVIDIEISDDTVRKLFENI